VQHHGAVDGITTFSSYSKFSFKLSTTVHTTQIHMFHLSTEPTQENHQQHVGLPEIKTKNHTNYSRNKINMNNSKEKHDIFGWTGEMLHLIVTLGVTGQ
jgi:hypothetical protein